MATIRICNAKGCQREYHGRGRCRLHYNASPARKASSARYLRTPAGRVAQDRAQAKRNAAIKARRSHPETTAEPTHVSVPDLPQTVSEARNVGPAPDPYRWWPESRRRRARYDAWLTELLASDLSNDTKVYAILTVAREAKAAIDAVIPRASADV